MVIYVYSDQIQQLYVQQRLDYTMFLNNVVWYGSFQGNFSFTDWSRKKFEPLELMGDLNDNYLP